ncbi:hypothetical protein VPNG_06962 [Cytospora leucostoma]|uniref:Major facilitator superfamily (MFS) profile domain-containing protein n=1 Tax=Cytospora leucostoma TaxID=1230097 RepID=A0A423WXF4_9PEZI|nr:hypothetical protein VPNG_06962 [Cytospora leucostoma]
MDLSKGAVSTNVDGLDQADNTIVGTATPTITNEFHSLTDIGWYGSAYRLTTCSTQFFYGKIYEQFRVKWVFTTAVSILMIGSIVSAAAPSSAAFIVGRAIAGCGASGIVTGVFIFWINVPIGGVTIAVIIVLFKNPKNQKIAKSPLLTKLKQLNIPSLFIFTGSIVCLLLALEWGGTTYSWGSGRIIALLLVAGLAFAVFVTLEVLQKDRATIPVSVVLNRTVVLCVLYGFCASAAFSVIDYYLPIWFQAIKAAQTALAPEDIPAGMTAIGFPISIGAALFISISQNVFTNVLRQRLSGVPGIDIDRIIGQGATDLLQGVPASQKALVVDV